MAGAGISILVADLARSGKAPAWWRDAAAGHNGRELERAGPLRALVFPDALAALACATELQRGEPRTGDSRLRVGIDAGEEDRPEPLRAVAGRLCDRAEPGQVLVSQAARSLAEASGEHRFREVGAVPLDGLRSAVRVWELLWGEPEPRTRIRLCGGLDLVVDGGDLAARLPAGQAGALLCYLVADRERAHDREALVAVLWPEHPPKEPLTALRPLLSRLRRAIAPAVIEGRERIRVVLPEPIWVDVEEAARALESARSAARSEAWETVRDHAGRALELLRPRFLPAAHGEWVDARRRELEELELEAVEWMARSGLGLGQPELGAAERASRDLIAQAPYRETGYRFLMEALARSGNVAEALLVYDELRVLLRDELGTAPAAELQALHQRLLTGERRGSPPAAAASAGAASGPSPLPSLLSPRVRSELVGRERELAALRAAWRGSRAGGRRLVLVAGEAGIGKTRLTSELAREAHDEGTVLHGACHEEESLSYRPFVEALRHYVRGAALDWAQLARTPGAGELARLIPELAAVLRAEPATRPSDPETRRYLMFEAVSELLTEASTRAPLMLVLDDLHWADPATLHLLRHVMRAPQVAALLIVATYRDADIDARHPLAALLADLRRDGLFERISLDGLNERGVAELIASHAGHAAPPGIVATVYEQTAGNPFFVEEVMRHLIETGVLFEREGRWASALTADEIGVPEGVKDVLTSRLGRLSGDCRAALAQAAVLGRECSFDVLCAMAVLDEDALIPALEEAVAAQLIVEADRASGPAYAFTHALVRETLYGALSSPRRQRLHAAAARAIEQTGPYAPVAELAHHWSCAGDRGRALAATVAAATAADRRYAHDEAMRHYERALELWDAVAEPERHAGIDRVELGVRAGEAASVLGEPERAARLTEETMKRVDRAQDPMRAGVLAARLGRYRWIGGDTERALVAYEEAVATVPATPPSLERARVLAALAHALVISNRSEPARARSTEALAIARALEAPVVAGRAMTSLGAATARLEHPDNGLPLLLEARQQLQRAHAELDFLFVTYTLESVVLEDAGRLERAYEAAREGIEFTRAHGMHRNHRGWLEATGASSLIKLGRWVEAGELLETALQRGPSGITRRAVQLLRAELQLARGDLAGAAANAADGQRAVRGEQPFAGRLCDVLAALAIAHGDFDAAREHVRHGLEVLAPLDDLHALARLCWRGLQAEVHRAERERATPGAKEQEPAAGVAAALLESARALVTSADAATRAAELPALLTTCEAEFARATGRADSQRWAAAAADWQALNEPYPRAYCLFRAAESAVSAKRPPPEAAALLAQAGGIASRLGATPLVAAIESLARAQSATALAT
jgi:DNA-binding SARP family transcriptional activator/tetratricopeptide (TPR) repeat protein